MRRRAAEFNCPRPSIASARVYPFAMAAKRAIRDEEGEPGTSNTHTHTKNGKLSDPCYVTRRGKAVRNSLAADFYGPH